MELSAAFLDAIVRTEMGLLIYFLNIFYFRT